MIFSISIPQFRLLNVYSFLYHTTAPADLQEKPELSSSLIKILANLPIPVQANNKDIKNLFFLLQRFEN